MTSPDTAAAPTAAPRPRGPRRFPNAPEKVEVPTELCFELLEQLRLAATLIDPPEDFKAHKFSEPEVYAAEMGTSHRKLMQALADAMGVEISAEAGWQQ